MNQNQTLVCTKSLHACLSTAEADPASSHQDGKKIMPSSGFDGRDRAAGIKHTVLLQMGRMLDEGYRDIKIPPWFDKTEYLNEHASKHADFLDDNPVLHAALDKVLCMMVHGGAKRWDVCDLTRELKNLYDTLYECAVESAKRQRLENRREFSRSDLPPRVYSLYDRSLIDHVMTLSVTRDMLAEMIESMPEPTLQERWGGWALIRDKMNRLIKNGLDVNRAESKLRIYIGISNANCMDDLSKSVPPSVKKLDGRRFDMRVQSFETALEKSEEWLYRHYDPSLPPFIGEKPKILAGLEDGLRSRAIKSMMGRLLVRSDIGCVCGL